jgi:polysaccharide deacetylase 2 family uncharacterized protein YibQ
VKKNNAYNAVVIIAAVICAAFIFNAAKDLLHDRTVERVLSTELAASKVSDKDLVGKVKHVYIEKRYWVSDSFPFDDFEKRLQRALDKAGFKVLSISRALKEGITKGKREQREEVSFLVAERSSSNPVFRLTLIHRIAAAKPVPRPPEVKPSPLARPKLAIVLDDWGYNTKNLDAVLQVGGPVTLSVLPGLPYSTLIAQKAKERGFEIMIHMPMEPKAKIRLELTTLRTDMNEEEIRSNLTKAFQSVPGAVGMNNHEGSKATEDRKLMDVVFGELKKNGMFFMDSVVTNDSICEPAAKEAGVKFIKRSIFLDNESDPAYIKKQFEKAVSLALKTGYAVAIGHDRPNTVAAVKEMVPVIEEKGIDMVFVSSLAR